MGGGIYNLCIQRVRKRKPALLRLRGRIEIENESLVSLLTLAILGIQVVLLVLLTEKVTRLTHGPVAAQAAICRMDNAGWAVKKEASMLMMVTVSDNRKELL